MVSAPALTTTQLIIRLSDIDETGLIDLTNLNLSKVNLGARELHERLKELTEPAGKDEHILPYIDFTGADISGLDFSGFDLTRTILSHVIAAKTLFAGANLSDVTFNNADVSGADFRRAVLRYTKFYDAIIDGANFSGADMILTRGLGFAEPGSHTVERLGVAGNIHEALLPSKVEKMRPKIQRLIDKNIELHKLRYAEQTKAWQQKQEEEGPEEQPDDVSSSLKKHVHARINRLKEILRKKTAGGTPSNDNNAE